MAFDKDDTEAKPIGTFKFPSNGQIIDCLDGMKVSQQTTSTLLTDLGISLKYYVEQNLIIFINWKRMLRLTLTMEKRN